MYILGITDNHDTGVTLFKNNELVYAISEERLNREKLTRKFPIKSINKTLNDNEITLKDIDKVIIASNYTPLFLFRMLNKIHAKYKFSSPFLLRTSFFFFLQVLLRKTKFYKFDKILSKKYYQNKFNKKKIELIDHHLSHAYSAYSNTDFNEALVITVDGMGDGLSITVSIARNNILKKIYEESGNSAVGRFFTVITDILGFVPTQDEGKVVGLAAYGNPDLLLKKMEKYLFYNGKNFNKFPYMSFLKKSKIKKDLCNYSKEDIAAAAQKNLEVQLIKFIKKWIKKTGIENICLAGGVFANVKLNQKIHELKECKNIFIFPHMGDGGLCVGSINAYLKMSQKKLKSIYLGPKYSNKNIEEILKNRGIKYKKINSKKKIAKLLASKKIIGLFHSNMEFGPRSLGNRSIICHPGIKNIQKILNTKLKRTQFMPFTPTVLSKYAKKCYIGIEGAEYTAKYMNITFNTTKWMKKNCSGVVHVDGTSRPQLLEQKDNPFYYDIIDEFEKLTGIPC
ncbi:hypothetical protein HOD20_09750, partial [archaeon]|nr:hypothetical protein [archaeon]